MGWIVRIQELGQHLLMKDDVVDGIVVDEIVVVDGIVVDEMLLLMNYDVGVVETRLYEVVSNSH